MFHGDTIIRMKQKVKTLVKILTPVIVVITVALFLGFRSARNQKAPQKLPTLPDINLPKTNIGVLPIEIVDEEINFQTSENAPLINISLKSISQDYGQSVATSLDFDTTPLTIDDVKDGKKIVWYTKDRHLWVTPKKSHLKYGINGVPLQINNLNLNDKDLSVIAVNFLSIKFLINRDKLQITSIEPLKRADNAEGGFIPTTKDQAILYQVNLTYKDAGYTILTTIPSFPILYVQILPNGEIFKAEANLFEEISKSSTEYELKNIEEIKSSLYEVKLISLENDYISVNDLKSDDITDLDISSIELGYYYNDKEVNTLLQPIFLLKGNVKIKNSVANLAKLYLPALKTSTP